MVKQLDLDSVSLTIDVEYELLLKAQLRLSLHRAAFMYIQREGDWKFKGDFLAISGIFIDPYLLLHVFTKAHCVTGK